MNSIEDFKSIVSAFKCESTEETKIVQKSTYKVTKTNKKSNRKEIKISKQIDTINLPDLARSLDSNLKVLFIGYNPGVQSSIQQHHYAHHSNLYWKLFRQSKLLEKIVELEESKDPNIFEDDLNLKTLLENGCTAKDDFDIIKYKIGFSDLCSRCTKRADELTSHEKFDNVKRLIGEIYETNTNTVVLIGKGIWETFIKFYSLELNIKFKLTKDNFQWGEVMIGNDNVYNKLINHIQSLIPSNTKIHVFPSTSGLVAGITFAEKLRLWETMVDRI
ncbi:thp1 [Candida pseudojiufengensis]|uniref:thp1 n=1 Tax=Candida pseudojiufengensis TaxID=497109 RepID=UPI0022258D51|nr:thp1 [Candida pseudojiufengensis]KAI5965189.1 thp1 [Candida pseudojiufengensis]